MQTEAEFDPWTQSATLAPRRTRQLPVTEIKAIRPLDFRSDPHGEQSLPAPLFDLLFGTPSAPHTGTSRTYALLDAAKIPGLPELLDTSGLSHRCLFTGTTFDALKDAAPWLVELDATHRFTTDLLTRSDAPWHLWDAAPGIYLRSKRDLNEVWQHLRKFTRLRDETGKWYYFRFWEPGVFTFICNSMPKPALFMERFFAQDKLANTIVFAKNTALITARTDIDTAQTPAISLDEHLLEVLRDYAAFRNTCTITDQHAALHRREFAFKGYQNILENNQFICAHAQHIGASSKVEVSSLCYLALWLGRDFLQDPLHRWAQTGLNEPGPKARTLYWQDKIFSYFDDVLGPGGAVLARAAGRALDRMDRFVNGQTPFSVDHCLAIMTTVYPEKITFAGTDNARDLARLIEAEPRFAGHGDKYFVAFCCLFFGVGFLRDPISPFCGTDFAKARTTDLHDRARRLLTLRSKPAPHPERTA